MEEKLYKRLRKTGHRITGVRKAVIGIFAHGGKPLSVGDVSVQLKKNNLTPDKATLYRTITCLKENGFIREVDFGSGMKLYESTAGGHHHHLVCIRCNGVQDMTLERELEDEERRIAEKKGFKVLRHSLEFFGVCKNCTI